ncbi:MAG: hypothetical protein WCE51_16560, partial [Chthoniobacterales bacterium]
MRNRVPRAQLVGSWWGKIMNCVEENINANANQQIWRKMFSVTLSRPADARMSKQEKTERAPSNHEDEISDRNGKLRNQVGIGEKRRKENNRIGAMGDIGQRDRDDLGM